MLRTENKVEKEVKILCRNSTEQTKSMIRPQPLTEMSTRNIKIIMFLRSEVRRVRRDDNLTAICEPFV
jgi:hypothetical protein